MNIITDPTIQLIGIAALCVLISLSAAKTLGEASFLISLMLIGGGYLAILVNAFFGLNSLMIAVALTVLGMIIGRFSASRDIPTVEWRARGLNSSLMAVTFTALALVTLATMSMTPGSAYKAAAIAYGVLAAWNWIIAIQMASRVMGNYDGKSK